jgi:L,D-transpeptidase ErfK/SrfK
MRLYYYHPDGVHVSTFPVGVGQEGWNTPLGTTQVVRKREHPVWVVPDSILENHEEHGQPIEKVWPAGPNNPLGDYAMNLGFKNIVIHGSPYPKGVGVRSSHGCIRMLNEDVEKLYNMVQIGTPVTIIHQPTKIGRLDNKLYLEAHVPLSQAQYYATGKSTGDLIHNIVKGAKYTVQWNEIEKLQNKANGYPQPIGSVF